MRPAATIVEVGPRDGLQNEKQTVSTASKLELLELLHSAGVQRLEVTAFVSPKWVPQMADHEQVLRRFGSAPGLIRSVLVPNERGAAAALAIGVEELAIFTSASETFARKNINCSIAESLERFKPVAAMAMSSSVRLRGYVSCSFECPYEGEIAPEAVLAVARSLADLGCNEISIADTIGQAKAQKVEEVMRVATAVLPASVLACHFHDTHGRALENVDVALANGIRIFDSSIGGLGGCPYAPGAAGNLSTIPLAAHLEKAGYTTGLDMSALEKAQDFAFALGK